MSTHACAHLHVHSEYSLLDGAANIDGLAARAAAFGQPALGLTDHGVMNGASSSTRPARSTTSSRSSASRPTSSTTARSARARSSATTSRCSPPATRASRTSPSSPAPASSRACTAASRASTSSSSSATPRASSRSRAASPPAPPPDRRGPAPAGARPPRRARPDLRPRGRLLRGPAQRHRRAGAGQRGDPEVREGAQPPARRHRRRPLPPQGGLPPPRRAAVRADEVDARRPEDELRHQRVLFEELGGDGGVVQRHAGGARLHGRDRRALRDHGRARPAADPALRHAQRRVRGGATSARSSTRACASATATRSPPRPASAPTWSSPSSATWASTPTS